MGFLTSSVKRVTSHQAATCYIIQIVIIDLSIAVNTQHWSGRAERCSKRESEETLEKSLQVKNTESVNLKNHHKPSLVSKSPSPKDQRLGTR